MNDVPVTSHLVGARPDEEALDRAFVVAYAVALAGNLAVSFLTYVYVGTGSAHEANPVTAAIIASIGLEGMVVVRTAVLVGSYRCYAAVRAWTSWSTAVIAFAWIGAALQLANLAADLRVAALVGLPAHGELVAGLTVVAPALLAGVVLRPLAGTTPFAESSSEPT